MKINVTVDLEDLYDEISNEHDGHASVNKLILDEIRYRVKSEVWGEFRKTTLDEFKTKINNELSKGKDAELNRIITKVFTEKKIKTRDGSKNSPEELVTLFEYIEDRLTKDYFSMGNTAEDVLRDKIRSMQVDIEKNISKAADKIGNELKDRYDLLFASQLVAKMNEVGLLKTDVANLLLPKTENPE